MIVKKEASGKHFFISEKIKEVRPKRNNIGDIEKCITLCEEGMDNLADFIKEDYDNSLQNHLYLKEIGVEREFATPFVPPSILCRDILIDCYLMTDQFDLAENVVERTLTAKAWTEEQSAEQVAFVLAVQNARSYLFERLKKFPGTLQKDIYVILPSVDKKAMKWYLANSRTIYKVKLKTSYSLWLNKEDVPEEEFEASKEVTILSEELLKDKNDLANELLSKNDLSIQFPKWYVSVSFGKSTSTNYSKALMLSKESPLYIESLDADNNIIHQAVYSDEPNEYLSFVSLYELIHTWKSTFTIINGNVIDRKIIGGLNYCYGDKIRSGDPDFCFGASFMTENPFGCHRLQISQFNNPWWTFGEFNNIGVWVIDKEAILKRVKEFSLPYINCPSFSMEGVLDGLDNIPDFINLKRNHNWVRNGNGVRPKDSDIENSMTLPAADSQNEKKQSLLSSILKLTGLKK